MPLIPITSHHLPSLAPPPITPIIIRPTPTRLPPPPVFASPQLVAVLQDRNEQLALKSAALSEADFESVRGEFEQRLAAAERKVYALTKERDALRKGAEKLTESHNIIREREETIKQVGRPVGPAYRDEPWAGARWHRVRRLGRAAAPQPVAAAAAHHRCQRTRGLMHGALQCA